MEELNLTLNLNKPVTFEKALVFRNINFTDRHCRQIKATRATYKTRKINKT